MNDEDGAADKDLAFVERMRQRLAAAAAEDHERDLTEAFRGLAPVRAVPRRRLWSHLFAAFAAAAVAALVTWLAMRPVERPGSDPAAFDGGAGPGTTERTHVVRWDTHGRLAESELDGERLVFRSGRLVRIERREGGLLDGEIVDFDGTGRIVRIETWTRGKLTGTRAEP